VVRYGALRVCQVCLACAAIALLLGASGFIVLIAAAALLMGVANGPPTPASSHVMLEATPPRLVNFVFALKQTGVPVGGAAAGLILPGLAGAVGWRGALLMTGAACLLLALLLQPWRPRLDAGRNPAASADPADAFATLTLVWRAPTLRILALATTAICAIQGCIASLFVTFLTQSAGQSLARAGLILAVTNLSGIAGRLLWGVIADRLGRAPPVMIAMCTGVAIATALLTQVSPAWPFAALCALAAMLGATVLGWNGVAFAEIARCAPPGRAAEATGGAMFLVCCGVMGGPAAFTAVLHLTQSFAIGFAGATLLALLLLVRLLRLPAR
ncbi:MAG: MFS transporter, partial [Burkholderiaceae bacterium]